MSADGMHIALANYEFPPNSGGGGEFTASLANSLEDDHVVEVVAGERDGQTSSFGSIVSWPMRRAKDLRQAANRADVLNCHFTVPTSALAPILSPRTPLVVNCMGADIYDPTRYQSLRPVLDALNRWVRTGADALIVPSEDMYDRLSRDGQEIAEVIPYFVDAERYQPGDSHCRRHKPLRLLSVARLVERKRLDRAIEAVAILDGRGVDVELTLVGSGPERKFLESKAKNAGISDNVFFRGYVPDKQLPDLYRAHDIFVLPSAHEAFGISVVEAMASGLPAVVTDTGGHSEVVGDGGITTAADASSIADGIRDAMFEYRYKAEQSRKRALDRYSAQAVVPKYVSLFETVQ